MPPSPFHFAFIRRNNVLRIAINGIFGPSSFTDSSSLLSGTIEKFVGHEPSTLSSKFFLGKIEDLCIIAGKALWTENFTPPTIYLPDKW